MPTGVDVLYRCNVTWYLYGQNCINSIFLRCKETSPYPTVAVEIGNIHDDLRNWFISPLRGVMSQSVQLLSSVLQAVSGTDLRVDVRNYVGQFGGVASDALPSDNAMVLSWRTPYSGRRTHGRTYIPGVPKIWQDGNRLTSGGQSALDGAAGTILDKFGEGGSDNAAWMVIFSRKNGTTREPGPPPFISYSPLAGIPITRYVVDSVIYTQRHRLEGRGI